jgi:ATP-dependent DNA helicase RecQ
MTEHEHNEPLAALPEHVLAHVTGERRRRLVEYLLRWHAPQAALRCLEVWLGDQPHLATLREARARALLECGRAAEALPPLDELDAERGMTEGRRALRMQALAALERWDEAHALIANRPHDPATWRARAELLLQQRRLDEAATALARMAALLPDGSAPLRRLAELALAQGDAERARALLRWQAADPGSPPPTAELLLLRRAAEALGDTPAVAALDAQLAERRAREREWLRAELGLDEEDAALSSPLPRTGEGSGVRASPRTGEGLGVRVSQDTAEASPGVMDALRTHFGFAGLRPGQAAIIARVLRGESVLGVLPTGAGKSLTYQLPALLLPGATLVLSPLIALMKDQIDGLPPALSERATAIHSGLSTAEAAERLRGVAEGRYRLVYVAPERLRQQPFVQALRRAGVARVVVDEAHCVSLWGISFRPDYLFIRRALEQLGSPPVLALTATATPETAAEIAGHLGTLETIRTSIFRPNLRFEVVHATDKSAKLDAVVALCRQIDGPVVVYARSREMCERLASRLRAEGVSAEHYHAQVADRSGVQERFMGGATRVLAATVAFGMGVDKADVRAIVHYNLPQSLEAYYQEAGRAGRDGLPARCVLLYAPADKGQLTAWLREDALTKEHLRLVYGALRRRMRGTWGVVAVDELRRELGDEEETRTRVALGLLERVGLLARHFDLPRSATLTLYEGAAQDAELRALIERGGITAGEPLEIDLIALADCAGHTPDELERRLLDGHERRVLRYEGYGRDALLERLPAPADVGERLDALLAEYAARQDARVEAIARYARSVACRHRAIAAHFGERLAACGDTCDICAGGGKRPRHIPKHALHAPPPPQDTTADPASAIVRCMAHLPFPVGRSGLAKVLKGSAGSAIGPDRCPEYAALSHLTLATIERAIDGLIADGRLARQMRDRLPLLALTERGRAQLIGGAGE